MATFGTALEALRAEREKLHKRLAALDRAIAVLAEDDKPVTKMRRRGRKPGHVVHTTALRPVHKRRPFSEETKAKMRDAQRRRREQEREGQAVPNL